MGSTLEEHRAATRQRVYAALTELLAERSFESISMADLAAAAGIGRTSIYNHFRDKNAVVVAFATAETERYVAQLNLALEGVLAPEERLRVYVRHHLATSAEFHFGLGPELYSLLSGEARLQIREHVKAVEDVLRSIIETGVTDGVFVTPDIQSSIALIHACLQPRQLNPEAVEEFVARALEA